MSDDGWTLYYHSLAGRGEFVRVIFEEVGVKFKEVNDADIIRNKMSEIASYPVFAPPVLMKGDFTISQTPMICKYLGRQFGLWPDSEEDQWHAEQLNATIHDYIAEGRLVFHGRCFIESYYTQKKETQPYIDWFVDGRIQRWLGHFEKVLAANNGGNGFLVGSKLTYVDLGLLHVLRATESQFPEAWAKLDTIPLLKAFKDRISARPNLAAYFKSDRCRPFEGNSMM